MFLLCASWKLSPVSQFLSFVICTHTPKIQLPVVSSLILGLESFFKDVVLDNIPCKISRLAHNQGIL